MIRILVFHSTFIVAFKPIYYINLLPVRFIISTYRLLFPIYSNYFSFFSIKYDILYYYSSFLNFVNLFYRQFCSNLGVCSQENFSTFFYKLLYNKKTGFYSSFSIILFSYLLHYIQQYLQVYRQINDVLHLIFLILYKLFLLY